MVNLSSTYNEKPITVWLLVAVIVAVGIFYIVRGFTLSGDISGLFTQEELDSIGSDVVEVLENIVFTVYLIFALISFVVAFLCYNGSKGGRTILLTVTFLTVIFDVVALFWGVRDMETIFLFICALLAIILVYRPEVKRYFNRSAHDY